MVCSLLMAAAVAFDVHFRKIPNQLTVSVAATGLLYHLVLEAGVRGLWFSVTGLLVGGLLLVIPFALGMSGGGDVKLLGAAGAWMGPSAIFSVFLYGSIAGGVFSIVEIIRYMGFGENRAIGRRFMRELTLRRFHGTGPAGLSIPYSIPIAVGLLTYLLIGDIREWM